ncbi:MAG: type I-B CRISPR-associated protein Cas5b [Thermomicrobium sp.]|nr:type I-B CRISPR-associated protein Cas5b [Thermomicrobium sp.]MDW8006821.1 type I-B CRISPR-associated protein Cas5b [Thermomicrobium sp.]
MLDRLPLQAVRIRLTGYTASFRAPSFVAYQLSLPVPPLATIFGLLSAAAGRWVMPDEVEWVAYRLTYSARAMDLETIYGMERAKPTDAARYAERNVVRREFLVAPELLLYLPVAWAESFRRPRYPLVLGRSQDLATVEEITTTVLEWVSSGEVTGVLLPIEVVWRNGLTAVLHNLPIAFTADPEREPVRVALFGSIDGQRVGSRLRMATITEGDSWLVRDIAAQVIVPLYQRKWLLYGDT